uniref:Estrogen-related receptor n=1 Tax=Strigamia maritima TaxID=126957 RepID=T1IPY4_STRMM
MANHNTVIVSHIKCEEGVPMVMPCSPSDSSEIYSPTLSNGKTEDAFTMDAGQCSPSSPDRQDMFCSSTMPGDGPLVSSEGTSAKEDDSPKRLCLVCGDVASGFHYGVASCEACKAFFKRTIQGNIEYTCPAANDCEINKRRRKACQACRFQKCLRMGMLKEGVRLDRVRGGRQKYRRNPETPYQIQMVTTKKPSLEDNKLLYALNACEPETLVATPDPNLPDSDYKAVCVLSDLADRELVGAIGWAKQIPGFTDLSLNDQMHSLQSSWSEILTLSLAYRSLPMSGRLHYATDFVMDEKQARACHAEDLFTHCLTIVERLERIGILKEEYLILKALLPTNTDAHVGNTEALKKLRETLLAGLIEVVSVLRPNNPQLHLGNLLLCLPILRQVDTIMRRFWSNVRRDGKVPMNKLFIEMLESHLR